MNDLLVKDWMTAKVITVDVHSALPDAHKLMRSHKIRRLPVLDSDGQLQGVITESGIFRILIAWFDQ